MNIIKSLFAGNMALIQLTVMYIIGAGTLLITWPAMSWSVKTIEADTPIRKFVAGVVVALVILTLGASMFGALWLVKQQEFIQMIKSIW